MRAPFGGVHGSQADSIDARTSRADHNLADRESGAQIRGLPVRTVRFWIDAVVPLSAMTEAHTRPHSQGDH
ncbi:uncharacterized protein TRAVEDRAFT_30270 [Trametes versicolor FP-101664 SS1]|uniref:uncharacterized protein n=1 Tax=Trametes versicolor (strain FP-101664) TaxID=717944 RepID=UPI0004624930|nr:uncharacterized protein TRAVEDRAFT_30270 [Trametes versicolor FP-101664 SS1]EIW57039.1 hypothetical protein TRAVEDRAFT_30270 [Trametes versicolor FP-101664 SS1]